jgi:hypothetical protein
MSEDLMVNQVDITIVIVIAVLLAATVSGAAAATEVRFEQHRLHLTLDVPEQSAQIDDEGSMMVTEGWNLFYLNLTAVIDSLVIEDRNLEYIAIAVEDTAGLPQDILNNLPMLDPDGEPQLVFFETDHGGIVTFRISYSATFADDVDNTQFSKETVGREVSGTILDQGAYLSPSSYYYPRGDEDSFQLALTVNIPSAWESISDGNRLANDVVDNRKTQSWANPFKSDGVTLMAAPYVTHSARIDGIWVACYFFEADTSLIESYLNATISYIKMYSDLIGPYPYQRFTVAENFFSTGYGMPAWTLLGQEVIRLPFIVRTSLGHEVLHNWWGNSVYVDYKRGNWCEGAAVYGAAYRYKLLQSSADARAYRKNILKQYDSYINEQNDFPIREFDSRSSTSTSTVGYSKAMMVFHMIQEEIGPDAFFATWKQVYTDFIGKQISWEEWLRAFERSSGEDLSHFIPQWIEESGAPVIDIRIDKNVPDTDDGTRSIAFTLFETSGQEYRLKVPLRFEGTESTIDTSVVLTSPESACTLTVPLDMTLVSVDPEYNLFRKLYAEEIEPIISAIMGNPDKRFISHESDALINEMFGTFGANLTRDSVHIGAPDALHSGDTAEFPVILNPLELPAYLKEEIQAGADSLTINDTAYPLEGHTFILTGQDWQDIKKYMVVVTNDSESLPRIGQLVPHYGKYSFLVFKGTRNVGKGQWPAGESPLMKEL